MSRKDRGKAYCPICKRYVGVTYRWRLRRHYDGKRCPGSGMSATLVERGGAA